MDLYLVLLFGFLSMVQLSQAQQPVEEEIVSAINVEPLGGWTNALLERKDVQEAAQKAVENFNIISKSKKYFKLLNVTAAQTQVTNMINFKIEATISKTKCLKSEPADLEACDLGRKRFMCEFEVEFDPRKDKYTVKDYSCKK